MDDRPDFAVSVVRLVVALASASIATALVQHLSHLMRPHGLDGANYVSNDVDWDAAEVELDLSSMLPDFAVRK